MRTMRPVGERGRLVIHVELFEVELGTWTPGETDAAPGEFDPAALTDFWDRSGADVGDGGASVAYQSVLTGLEWGEIGRSLLLSELRQQTVDALLSIKVTPPTVNNQVTNFDNATFDPSLQAPGGPDWYPSGDGVWRLVETVSGVSWNVQSLLRDSAMQPRRRRTCRAKCRRSGPR